MTGYHRLHFFGGLFNGFREIFRIAIGLGVPFELILVQRLFLVVWIELDVQIVIDVLQISLIQDGRSRDVDVIANPLPFLEHADDVHPAFFEKEEYRPFLGHPFATIAFGHRAHFGR